jgi:hypothetical protein
MYIYNGNGEEDRCMSHGEEDTINGHGGEKLIVSKETYYSVKRDLLVLTAMAARS